MRFRLDTAPAKLTVHHRLEVEAGLDSWFDHISAGGYIVFIQ
jgi:hypothetical protein